MDAIMMLKNEHRTVEDLFKRFEKAGDRAFTTKRGLVDRMIEDLSQHAAIEEEVFYPATRSMVPGIEEHHIVKWVLSELERLDPHAESFDAKVTVLIENVRHHVKEEEKEYFPKVRSELSRRALIELGDLMVSAKAHASKRPHPRLHPTPPKSVRNRVAAVADHAKRSPRGELIMR
jgi:hemerythrin superfamily protein